jgi:plastocyanin
MAHVRQGALRRERTPLLALVAMSVMLAGVLLGAGAPRSRTRPALRHVVIHEMRFDPVKLTVAVGDTVEWVNRDLVPHTATAQSREWDSGNIAAEASWRTVVPMRGAYPYVCLFHPGMRAHLIVR